MQDIVDKADEQITPKEVRFFTPKLMRELNHKDNKKFRKEKRRNSRMFSSSSHKNKILPYILQDPFLNLDEKLKILESSKKIIPSNSDLINVSSRNIQKQLNAKKVIGRLNVEGLSGQTDVKFSNGAKFKGKFRNGNILSGKFQFTNGFVYEGGFMQNKFFGQGALRFPNGKVISGDWNGEKIVGNGEIKYPGGEIYYGEIENFKKNGYGYFFFKDGRKFIGHYKEGKIKGKGSYYIDQKLVAQGNWQAGQLISASPLDTSTLSQLNSYFLLQNQQVSHTSIFQPQKVYSPQFTQYSVNSRQPDQPLRIIEVVSENDDSEKILGSSQLRIDTKTSIVQGIDKFSIEWDGF